MMIKICARCEREFDGYGNTKYCPDCRPEAKRERNRRYYIKSKLAILRGERRD